MPWFYSLLQLNCKLEKKIVPNRCIQVQFTLIRIMPAPCSRCAGNEKVLLNRPECCVALDGKPCTVCTEDNELQKEIKELEISIEKLRIKRRARRTVMNESHDQLTDKVPPEIASQIFIQYASPRVPPNRNSLLILGAVCPEWRRLAWATPELWSSLFIEFRGSRSKHHDNLPQLVNEWLERSATLPLTITFITNFVWNFGDDIYHEISTTLNKHSARWHEIYFSLPARHLHLLCGSGQGNIVRQLVLVPSTYPNEHDPSDVFPPFSMKYKPSPTQLTLGIPLRSVDILWDNLSIASVKNISIDECIELIRRSPLLEVLRLSGMPSLPLLAHSRFPMQEFLVLTFAHWSRISRRRR